MNKPPAATAIANLRLDVEMAASDDVEVRFVDLEVALEEIDRLTAELAEAREDREWLGFLNEAGIDNSPAYDYACQLRREARRAAVPPGAEEASESA